MSKTTQTILWVVIAVIVIGGVWWWVSMGTQNPSASSGTQSNAAQNGQPSVATNNTTGGTSAISATDTSDATLNQDLATLDGEMNQLSSDSASIDQGLNDQQITQ